MISYIGYSVSSKIIEMDNMPLVPKLMTGKSLTTKGQHKIFGVFELLYILFVVMFPGFCVGCNTHRIALKQTNHI